jgi:hypothetical protein
LIGSRGEGVDQAVLGKPAGVVSVGASLAIIEMLGEEGKTLVAEHVLSEERPDRGMEQILSNRHRTGVVREPLLGARIGVGGLGMSAGLKERCDGRPSARPLTALR